MRFLILNILFSVTLTISGGNVISLSQDSLIFEKYKKSFNDKADLTIDELIVETALFFRGTPYVASTLDSNKEEQLVVNLRELDCTTLVENCIALAKTMQSDNQSFDDYRKNLQQVRYRDGIVDGYGSRLHYITDWSYDNQKKQLLTDVTESIGGVKSAKKIDFMSSHINSYLPLVGNNIEQNRIRQIEQDINERGKYYFVEKDKIETIQDQITDGDIIVFATSIAGLDYTHMGIAYRVNGILKFIHASTRPMKVVVESQSLVDYCQQIKKCTGITVLRIN